MEDNVDILLKYFKDLSDKQIEMFKKAGEIYREINKNIHSQEMPSIRRRRASSYLQKFALSRLVRPCDLKASLFFRHKTPSDGYVREHGASVPLCGHGFFCKKEPSVTSRLTLFRVVPMELYSFHSVPQL